MNELTSLRFLAAWSESEPLDEEDELESRRLCFECFSFFLCRSFSLRSRFSFLSFLSDLPMASFLLACQAVVAQTLLTVLLNTTSKPCPVHTDHATIIAARVHPCSRVKAVDASPSGPAYLTQSVLRFLEQLVRKEYKLIDKVLMLQVRTTNGRSLYL